MKRVQTLARHLTSASVKSEKEHLSRVFDGHESDNPFESFVAFDEAFRPPGTEVTAEESNYERVPPGVHPARMLDAIEIKAMDVPLPGPWGDFGEGKTYRSKVDLVLEVGVAVAPEEEEERRRRRRKRTTAKASNIKYPNPYLLIPNPCTSRSSAMVPSAAITCVGSSTRSGTVEETCPPTS